MSKKAHHKALKRWPYNPAKRYHNLLRHRRRFFRLEHHTLLKSIINTAGSFMGKPDPIRRYLKDKSLYRQQNRQTTIHIRLTPSNA